MAIGLQLLLDDVQVSHGILGSSVHQVNQQTGAFDMTQKVVAKTSALCGPFNQAWYVCKNSAVSTGPAHHTKVGDQGGEGVIGNLGSRCRQHGDQGAFAGIGKSNDAHLSQQLEFQLKGPFLTLTPLGEFLRSTVAIAQVMGIAQTTSPTEGNGEPFTRRCEVAQKNAGAQMAYLRAARHLDHQVFP